MDKGALWWHGRCSTSCGSLERKWCKVRGHTKMWALLGSQGANSDSVSINWSDTDTTCHVQAFSNDLMLTIMRIGNSYWILVFFAICLLLQNAGFFASDPPSPSPEWAVQLFMWEALYIEICYAYSGGAGGGPSPKVRTFWNCGWPDSGKFWGSIAYPYSTSLCPYSPKTEKIKKTTKRDVQIETTTNPMHHRNFWHVPWTKEHSGGMVAAAPVAVPWKENDVKSGVTLRCEPY